jgi:hypothetical protein
MGYGQFGFISRALSRPNPTHGIIRRALVGFEALTSLACAGDAVYRADGAGVLLFEDVFGCLTVVAWLPYILLAFAASCAAEVVAVFRVA